MHVHQANRLDVLDPDSFVRLRQKQHMSRIQQASVLTTQTVELHNCLNLESSFTIGQISSEKASSSDERFSLEIIQV